MQTDFDVIVVGGGPAGMAAALAARGGGAERVMIAERERELGGILNQCIHSGFGLHYFGEEMTGPEYAERFVRKVKEHGIEARCGTTALSISHGRELALLSREAGYTEVRAGAVVLATGCRERTRGAIAIPGTRPAGVLTAGAAQRYVNIEGLMVGRRVLILGSGDIGLIMARRMALEGARVLACVEVMPYSGGLARNIAQCLNDYDIPLYLSHTVTEIRGENRVSGAVVARVDENRRPVPGSELLFECDTVLLSVGLIPENELGRAAGIEMDGRTGGAVVDESMHTGLSGVFACGNALHVHDLADYATLQAERAGRAAADWLLAPAPRQGGEAKVLCGGSVACAVPQRLSGRAQGEGAEILFRTDRVFGGGAAVRVHSGGKTLARYKKGRMAPGEMQRAALPAALLARAAGGDICVEICGEGAP